MLVNATRKHQSFAAFAVVTLLLSMVGPRLALVEAESQGLLLKTLAASEARERSRENPESRSRETGALKFAVLAESMPLVVPVRSKHAEDLACAADISGSPAPVYSTLLVEQASPEFALLRVTTDIEHCLVASLAYFALAAPDAQWIACTDAGIQCGQIDIGSQRCRAPPVVRLV